MEGQLALELDARTFSLLHYFPVDDLWFLQIHLLRKFYCGNLCNSFVGWYEHIYHDRAVRCPFHLGLQQIGVPVLLGLLKAHVDVIHIIQFVDEDDLVRILEGASADEFSRIVHRIGIVLGNIVVAKVSGYRRKIVFIPGIDGVISYTAVDLACDAVTVSLWIESGINEESLFNSLEVSADLYYFLHEQTGPLLDFPHHLAKGSIFLQLNHFHETVKSDQRLLCRVTGLDVVNMPGNVSSFIRGDGGLNICPGKLGNQHVENMGDGGFSGGGLHVLCIHLRPHPVFITEIPKGHRIGQVHEYARCRRRRRRYRRQADI